MEEREAGPVTARRRPSLPVIVDAAILAGLLVFLAQAMRPDFRGGRFVMFVLLAAVAFAAVILASEIAQAITAGRRRGAGAAEADAAPSNGRGPASWPVVWRSLVTVVALFVLVLFLGTVVGMTILAWVILRWHIGAGIIRTTAVAVGLGLVVPVVFSSAIGVPPWPGLVPELVPGWVGGGILPAL